LPECHDHVRALAGLRPVVVCVLAALIGLLFAGAENGAESDSCCAASRRDL
jgi:hypothetical protein